MRAALIALMLTIATQAGASVWDLNNFKLEKVMSIEVALNDNATGACWTNLKEVRRSVREEIKGGASFIKLMANGGVSARNNPIDHFGFSREEIATAVEEAKSAETYCVAHLYTNEAIARCIELGVRCVEHGNFIQPETAALMKKKGAVSVPTLVTYEALSQMRQNLICPLRSSRR